MAFHLLEFNLTVLYAYTGWPKKVIKPLPRSKNVFNRIKVCQLD